MAEYKIVDDFQVKNMRVIVLDRPLEDGDYGRTPHIDGKSYQYVLNSVRQWIQLVDANSEFKGKTVAFV